MFQRLIRVGVVWGLLFSLLPVSFAKAEPVSFGTTLLISEVQTGSLVDGVENGSQEFIELYNAGENELLVSGWKVQYLSASGQTVTDLAALSGVIAPQSYVLLSSDGYLQGVDMYFGQDKPAGVLAKSGGHVRIVDDAGTVIDHLSWGSAVTVGSWPKVPVIAAGFSVKRILPDDPLAQVGLLYTASTQLVTPEGGGYTPVVIEPPEPENNDETEVPQLSCEGVMISELLPNPAGTDTGREFIELYNPTDEVIPLTGCALQVAGSSKLYAFGIVSLEPGAHAVFYSSTTGLSLPNAAGGTVWLLSADNVELQTVTYPGNLADDQAWAFADGAWQATYAPTPDLPNVALSLKPCPEGQVRNESSGRCIAIATTASTLSPCKEGQERNPETNRCRAVASAASTFESCAADQERNPETNRCRKTAAKASNIAAVTDVESGTIGSKTSWYITGAVVLAALSYAIYEYRQEILQRFRFFKK